MEVLASRRQKERKRKHVAERTAASALVVKFVNAGQDGQAPTVFPIVEQTQFSTILRIKLPMLALNFRLQPPNFLFLVWQSSLPSLYCPSAGRIQWRSGLRFQMSARLPFSPNCQTKAKKEPATLCIIRYQICTLATIYASA